VNVNGTTKSSRSGRECAAPFSFFAITLAMIFAPLVAHADSGVVRAKETRGPFVITIFSPAELTRALPADVTVMIQRRETGEVVTDAEVDLRFVPPAGANLSPNEPICCPANNPLWLPPPGQAASFRAMRARNGNKFLYGASIVLRAVGDWQLHATIRQGGEEGSLTCTLPVTAPPPWLARLWPCLALPPVVIALFALNQWLRRRTATPGRVGIQAGGCKTNSVTDSHETDSRALLIGMETR
jgi:hypothetical protein